MSRTVGLGKGEVNEVPREVRRQRANRYTRRIFGVFGAAGIAATAWIGVSRIEDGEREDLVNARVELAAAKTASDEQLRIYNANTSGECGAFINRYREFNYTQIGAVAYAEYEKMYETLEYRGCGTLEEAAVSMDLAQQWVDTDKRVFDMTQNAVRERNEADDFDAEDAGIIAQVGAVSLAVSLVSAAGVSYIARRQLGA